MVFFNNAEPKVFSKFATDIQVKVKFVTSTVNKVHCYIATKKKLDSVQ